MKYCHTLYRKTEIKWFPDLLKKETHPINKHFSICVFHIKQNSHWDRCDENVCHSNNFSLVDAFSTVNLHINCHHVCLCYHIWHFSGNNHFLCLIFIDSVNVIYLFSFFWLWCKCHSNSWGGMLIKSIGVLLNSCGNFKREKYLLV